MRFIDPDREYRRIQAHYEDAARMLAWPDERLFGRAPEVSGWSAAQHLEHLAKTNGRTFKGLRLLALGRLEPEHGRMNLAGTLLLLIGRFPRGRTRAPSFALPDAHTDRDALAHSLDRNRRSLEELSPHLVALADTDARMRHPRLGMLDARQWLRFVNVHMGHHFRIIRDVTAHL